MIRQEVQIHQKVICEEYPDLVICDIMKKGMSGEELS